MTPPDTDEKAAEDVQAEYLGDGVYARFDGYQVELTAGDNTIFVEPQVYNALKRFWKRCHPRPQPEMHPYDIELETQRQRRIYPERFRHEEE